MNWDEDIMMTLLKTNPLTPYSKLMLPLPDRVHDKKGKAKWDSKTETLSITLPIDSMVSNTF